LPLERGRVDFSSGGPHARISVDESLEIWRVTRDRLLRGICDDEVDSHRPAQQTGEPGAGTRELATALFDADASARKVEIGGIRIQLGALAHIELPMRGVGRDLLAASAMGGSPCRRKTITDISSSWWSSRLRR
jgi:hypothetical protein